jgi:hypothetical protein
VKVLQQQIDNVEVEIEVEISRLESLKEIESERENI